VGRGRRGGRGSLRVWCGCWEAEICAPRLRAHRDLDILQTHCNTLQRNCNTLNTLQHIATHDTAENALGRTTPHSTVFSMRAEASCSLGPWHIANTLQHTTNTLHTAQHAATQGNTLQNTAMHCDALHCRALASVCAQRFRAHRAFDMRQHTTAHGNALQHTEVHCNTLPRTVLSSVITFILLLTYCNSCNPKSCLHSFQTIKIPTCCCT